MLSDLNIIGTEHARQTDPWLAAASRGGGGSALAGKMNENPPTAHYVLIVNEIPTVTGVC